MMKMSKRILAVLLALLLPLLLAVPALALDWIAMNYLPGGSTMATPRM